MPYLTIHGRLGRASLFGGIPLGIAIWYTIKIFRMDDQELLRSALDPVLALSDIPFLVLFAFNGFALMQSLVQLLLCVRILPHKNLVSTAEMTASCRQERKRWILPACRRASLLLPLHTRK